MIIYVVMGYWDYEACEIVRGFRTKEAAEAHAELVGEGFCYDYLEVVEMEVE